MSLIDLFSDKNEKAARDAQVSGINAGRTAASGALAEGKTALGTGAAAAKTALGSGLSGAGTALNRGRADLQGNYATADSFYAPLADTANRGAMSYADALGVNGDGGL